MATYLKERKLYYLLLMASVSLFLIALGPGLFGSDQTINSWQHEVFHVLCHQDPSRSFEFNGATMAVCARCFGIYSGFAIFVALMRFTRQTISLFPKKWLLQLLILLIVINSIDVLGNLFNLWTNSLASRVVTGFLMGASAAVYLTDQFYTFELTKGDI